MARQKGLAGGNGGGGTAWQSETICENWLSCIQSTIRQAKHTIRRSIYQALLTKRQKSTIITDKEFGK